jgi:hypothetical protein
MDEKMILNTLIKLIDRTGAVSPVTLQLKSGRSISCIPMGLEIQNLKTQLVVLDVVQDKKIFIPADQIVNVAV